MRKSYLICKLALIAMAATTLYSCKKSDGIDNNTVIQKPYSLYVSDMQGALWNTNTGDSLYVVFPPDGYPMRSIVTSSENLLYVKYNAFLSTNNAHNYNPIDSTVIKNGSWQSIMLDVSSYGRVYLCNSGIKHGLVSKGLIYSEDHGASWMVDTMWNDTLATSKMTSITQLQNGTLFTHDNANQKLYVRTSQSTRWEVINKLNNLPTSAPGPMFYLSHFNNSIVLTDYTGAKGVWHSEDNGVNWSAYGGLPGNGATTGTIYSTYAPFDQDLLIGTDRGVFKLVNGSFTASNSGLAVNTVVRGITGKDNVYKNGKVFQYYFLATSTGLYRSEDNGQTWIMTVPGNYSQMY
ncbi:WD40/YVTN/BNR-like repeat-containing protein [Chitinophagaceae bacterium MMS25-I14]